MKRGGLFFAAFLFMGGVLRLNTPAPSHKSEPNGKPSPQSKAAHPSIAPEDSNHRSVYEQQLIGQIAGYFACSELASHSLGADAESHWNVPKEARKDVQFLVAIVPDPVHTHLALLFDRTLESLQQAVQQQGDYSFDRAILPWRQSAGKGSDGLAERQNEDKEKKSRESFPGLLIFRQSKPTAQNAGSRVCGTPQPLFVFLVADTPTSGIRAAQFQNAFRIMSEIRAGSNSTKRPLLIFGPSFSGSLESLSRQLRSISVVSSFPAIYVYSGNITGAGSVSDFKSSTVSLPKVHFATFQENDVASIIQFVNFAHSKGYLSREIAVLSEDDTDYGRLSEERLSEVVFLHFPREISFFRSAYEKEAAAKQQSAENIPGRTSLPLNLEEESSDDDAVPPFAGSQTSLSQQAIMLGLVSELQKHHTKFTILLATNPIDQLFLARYLRDSYPQGRVVVTSPDLLLLSQEDSLLQGVLGLNVYPLVPGQSDFLCDLDSPGGCKPETSGQHANNETRAHQDRLFESSSSVGSFNAMIGLLAILNPASPSSAEPIALSPKQQGENETAAHSPGTEELPYAEYADYSSSCVVQEKDSTGDCPRQPLLWLTILGHDGYWPIAALSDSYSKSTDARLPIAYNPPDSNSQPPVPPLQHSLSAASLPPEKTSQTRTALPPDETSDDANASHTTPAWNIAYCICFVGLLLHVILSLTGTFLSDSEMQAQFTCTHDKYGALVMAFGALFLSSAFALVMCARSPLVIWKGHGWLSEILWAPLPIFAALVVWDLYVRRESPRIAAGFLGASLLVTAFQVVLAMDWIPGLPTLWSTRYLHFASGVSPVPPFFLLLAAGYWWMWLSLRAMSIVDLRRPRLPAQSSLPPKAVRISDAEGEKIRSSSHPVKFAWRAGLLIIGLCIVALTVLDLRHPLQSLEGYIYDWGYCVVLAIAIAVYLGCLFRLTNTWFAYKHVLAGLDRSPLREAFGRMERLSWKSMWNPGGSTLRETYRVMSRTFENLEKLEPQLKNLAGAQSVCASIKDTTTAYNDALKTYFRIVSPAQTASSPSASVETKPAQAAPQPSESLASRVTAGGAATAPARIPKAETESAIQTVQQEPLSRAQLFRLLMSEIQTLQINMANTAGILIRDVLTPIWQSEPDPVVSVDDRIKKKNLDPERALAEEYAALVYVNFLQSVLLQMRTLVLCAGGMYVLIVCSLNVYPFEPHPALQILAVALLVTLGVVVGFVYAEMHRDAILSRLTSTNAGELGWDFWWRFVSAGAVPVFSLLAVQFPEISRFLFSWLTPMLQSAK